jgi:hypothetical protein
MLFYFRLYKPNLFIPVFICSMALLFSCKTQTIPDQGLNVPAEPGKIIFLTFSIVHNKAQKEYYCRLINQKTVVGKAKEIRSDNDSTLS